ncbi:hypothetical protein [Streptomyces shenzhenensis]|uniref:hypothetical protein n=1 Tax=Streptomyces shenzhenensis TaxID=943815 RepID=UPI00367AE9BB
MGAHPGATDTGSFDNTTAVVDARVTDRPEAVAAKTLDDFARGRAASSRTPAPRRGDPLRTGPEPRPQGLLRDIDS